MKKQGRNFFLISLILVLICVFNIAYIRMYISRNDARPIVEFLFEDKDPAKNTGTADIPFTKCGKIEVCQEKSGYALYFDGGIKYLFAEDTHELDLQEYTCMGWIYPESEGSDRLRMEVLEKTNAYWINRRRDTGLLRAGSFLMQNEDTSKWNYHDSPQAIPLKEWTHVASTYDGRFFRLYINGELVSTQLGDGMSVENTTGNLTIGCKMNFDGIIVAQWHGRLDDIRIFKRALDQSLIKYWMTKK